MVTLKRREVLAMQPIMAKIDKMEFESVKAIKFANIIKEVSKAIADFEHYKKNLIEVCGEKTATGEQRKNKDGSFYIKPEKRNECDAKIANYLDEFIGYNMPELEIDILSDLVVTPNEIATLLPIIKQ